MAARARGRGDCDALSRLLDARLSQFAERLVRTAGRGVVGRRASAPCRSRPDYGAASRRRDAAAIWLLRLRGGPRAPVSIRLARGVLSGSTRDSTTATIAATCGDRDLAGRSIELRCSERCDAARAGSIWTRPGARRLRIESARHLARSGRGRGDRLGPGRPGGRSARSAASRCRHDRPRASRGSRGVNRPKRHRDAFTGSTSREHGVPSAS